MRHIALISAAAATAILLAGCDQNAASTQSGRTGAAGSAPSIAAEPGFRSPRGELSDETKDFVNEMAMTDMFEVAASKIALERAKFPDIKEFAQTMIDNHTKSTENLKAALTQSGAADAVPAEFNADYKNMIASLNKATDQEYDRQYIDQQIEIHMNALTLLRDYAKDGDNPELRIFADMSAPAVDMYLDKIKDIGAAHGRRAAIP